jgi:hypothetical protein
LQYALAGKKGLFLVRITPEVISLLDYRKGFGHTELVTLWRRVANNEFLRLPKRGGQGWRRGREPAQPLSARRPSLALGTAVAPNKRRPHSADAKGRCVRRPARRLGKRVRVKRLHDLQIEARRTAPLARPQKIQSAGFEPWHSLLNREPARDWYGVSVRMASAVKVKSGFALAELDLDRRLKDEASYQQKLRKLQIAMLELEEI